MGTANRGLVMIKYIFNLALKWNIPGVESNPAAGAKLFEANNARERFLTAEETQRLRDAVEKSKNSQLKTSQRYAHLSQETLLAAVDAAARATGTNSLPSTTGEKLNLSPG